MLNHIKPYSKKVVCYMNFVTNVALEIFLIFFHQLNATLCVCVCVSEGGGDSSFDGKRLKLSWMIIVFFWWLSFCTESKFIWSLICPVILVFWYLWGKGLWSWEVLWFPSDWTDLQTVGSQHPGVMLFYGNKQHSSSETSSYHIQENERNVGIKSFCFSDNNQLA